MCPLLQCLLLLGDGEGICTCRNSLKSSLGKGSHISKNIGMDSKYQGTSAFLAGHLYGNREGKKLIILGEICSFPLHCPRPMSHLSLVHMAKVGSKW